jgi:tRNA pseudouridine55 synthase
MARIPIHGVVLLDKPIGLSSHTALARAKRAFQAAKAGHTGTLDPLASGLLPVCLGEATKFASDLLEADKAYRASVFLGVCTTTGDAEGEIIETRPVTVDDAAIEAVMERFRGPIEQIPPMYSALKRDGRPLYEYARQGLTLERAARSVTIHEIKAEPLSGACFTLSVLCSKGTYVRTLAEDIGRALGTGAHLAALRRVGVGSLRIDEAITLEALEALNGPARLERLLPVDTLVQSLPRVVLKAELVGRFQNGQTVSVEDCLPSPRVRVYGESEAALQFLGVAEIREPGWLKPHRLIASGL